MRLAEGRNRASNIISLGNAKMLFYCSTRYRKRGQEVLTSYPLSVAACLPAVKLVCFQTFLIDGSHYTGGSFLQKHYKTCFILINNRFHMFCFKSFNKSSGTGPRKKPQKRKTPANTKMKGFSHIQT